MGYAKRVPNGFVACFSKPDDNIYSEDTEVSVSAMNKSIERLVLEAPEQYQWEYKRFKKHPSGKKKVYYRKKKA